ncbi:formate dehydrogenase subunit alpha [Candidatus Magnetoovum chiemensis]|nr:formate dehydrogenase subunit alpha [Candidatus Magnetoovum chiemensis]
MLVVGSNMTEAHPIVGLHVKWAHARGARLIVVDPRAVTLTKEAELHLQLAPGTNVAVINGMLKVIIEEQLYNKAFIEEHTTGWDELCKLISEVSLDDVVDTTGVPKNDIIKAARYYASSKRAIILSGLGVDEHQYGTEGMFALINLSLATGNIGYPGTGVFCLRGQNNVQGSSDMGCLPHVFPSSQPVTDEAARNKFAKAWNKEGKLPDWIGKKSTQMMDSAVDGQMKALYIWGEDPAQTHGNLHNIRNALSNLEFLVYQDMFMTETARFADVILPVSSFAEKDGTFTNTERRVRLLNKASEPLEGTKPDWVIFKELSNRFGLETNFNDTAAIYDEMASLSTYFQGISHKRLGSKGLQWPCTDSQHPGSERLYVNGFPKGKAKFYAIPYRQQSEFISDKYPFILITGRRLYHFNNAAQTINTQTTTEKEEFLCINPNDMKRLKLTNGQKVRLISRRGEVIITVRGNEAMLEATVFTAFHHKEVLINYLIGGPRDTYTDTYNYKSTPVRIEPVQ